MAKLTYHWACFCLVSKRPNASSEDPTGQVFTMQEAQQQIGAKEPQPLDDAGVVPFDSR